MSLPKESIELLLATGRAQLTVQKGDDGEAFFIKPDGNPVGLKNFFAPTLNAEQQPLQRAALVF
jgi:hypothetical protein